MIKLCVPNEYYAYVVWILFSRFNKSDKNGSGIGRFSVQSIRPI